MTSTTSADPQRKARGTVVLLGAILVLLGNAVSPAAQTAPRSSLLYCGWFGNTIPTPAYIAANKAFLETQPFNGLVVYLRNDAAGFNATTKTTTTTPLSSTALATLLAPLRNTTFTTLRENFGLIQGTTPPDFFDDWSVPIANFGAVARALKDAGLKGIVFDNEQYFSSWGNYPTGCKYTAHTLAEYQTQARLRGRQVMEAMIAQFPEIAVITLHGPYVSEPRVPTPLFPVWYTANELFGPFFSGMMEGDSSAALNIDGGELYHLRTADEFYRSYNWRKFTMPSDAFNCAFIPPALRPAWPGKSSICFGVYDRPFGGLDMNPTIARTTIANALKQADRYVWFYTEGATFLKPPSAGGATAAWVDAVRQALADAATSTAPAPSGPAAPSHFAAAATSSSAVDLSWWDMSSNETGFEIERKTGTTGAWSKVLTTGANVSTIDDIGLAGSTTYVYRARAVNASGVSAYSAEATVATAAPPAPVPGTPTHLVATATSSSAIDLTWWDMSNNETSFEIERKTGTGGTWARVLTTGANISTIDDLGVSGSTTYYYRARAVSGAGPSTYSAEASATTPAPPVPVPGTPTHLVATATSSSAIDLAWWDMSNNETSFEIERKTGTGGTWSRILTTGANISTIDDIGLSGSTTYYYRARAVNASGPSTYSAEASATTPAPPAPVPAAPSHLVATPTSSSAIDLTWWDMSNNETSFEIERKTGTGGTWSRVLTTGANISTIDDIGLSGSTTYYYRARAVNASGPSTYSAEASATTQAPAGPVPAAPTHLSIRTRVVGRIGVTWWDMSNNETGFQVQRKTGVGGTWSLIATKNANVSIHDDYTVVSGLTYYYRVRSVNANGGSAWSNEIYTTAP